MIIQLVVMIALFVRLAGLERGISRTVILLTVLANKQGATEEDIRLALGETTEARGQEKSH